MIARSATGDMNAAFALLLICSAVSCSAQDVDEAKSKSAEQGLEFNPRRVLRALPPITEFPLKTNQEAGDELNPTELVLGVTIGNQSRAYPINMLTGPHREIINDQLGRQAIAATW